MRLIDADKLETHDVYDDEMFVVVYKEDIDAQPTIDAEPVRHGKWIYEPKDAIEMMHTKPKCSECGYESADGLHYCSNCGAKMDEEQG